MSENHKDVTKNPGISYESQDLNIRGIVYFGIGLLVVTVVAMVLIFGILNSLEGSNPPPPIVNTAAPPPEPRIMPNPIDRIPAEEQLEILRVQEEEILTTYGWVDQDAGVVRIPIEQAMEMVVEQNQ
jgi:hypothetical protein